MPPDSAALAASVADPAAQPAALAATVSALNELALALRGAGETESARSTWTAALRLAPDNAVLHANLGALLQALGQREAALTHYERVRDAAPDWVEVWNNSGILLRQLGRADEARAALQRALQLQPDHVAARYNLGNVLLDAGDKVQASEQFRSVLAHAPAHAEARYGLATCTADPLAAAREFQAALDIRPDFPEAIVGLACARLRACDWRDIDPLRARVESLVRERPEAPVSPFSFLQLCGEANLQRQCARNWTEHRLRRLPRAHLPAVRPAVGRLRVGYLSGDFRDHAVGNMVRDLFAGHDRDAFEVFAYSSGPDDGSAVRQSVRAGAEHFVDVRTLDDATLARRILDDGIDVLVDLSGYTEFGRSGVLSARPAPVQLSYLGYPGSMGSPFVDAILADSFLVPPGASGQYDERVVELDPYYQPSPDWNQAPAGPKAELRALHGLPADAFVFACFNNPYKIQPLVFAAWMEILRGAPESVLWLPAFNPHACANLREQAALREVDPARLVFAPLVSFDRHSARLPAADLFLDTHPYSAGATANQTLACGVPLLTMVGDCYVSRMAGSVLHALGLEELITQNLDDYVACARALARDRVRHAGLRERLRIAGPRLFNATTAARALEAAYRRVWEGTCRGTGSEVRP